MNSSRDTIEELTFFDAMTIDYAKHHQRYPYPSAFDEYKEKLEIMADKFDIDLDKELFDALEDSENVKNVEIKVIKSWPAKIGNDSWNSDINQVRVTFFSKNLGDVAMDFLVTDKTIFPPYTSKYLSLISYSTNQGVVKNYGQSHTDFLDEIYFRNDDI